MLVFRKFGSSLYMSAISILIWIDGSPQWRGSEMYAGTIEVLCEEWSIRWTLPVIALRSGMLDAVGKTLGLLWALWLMVGPSIEFF